MNFKGYKLYFPTPSGMILIYCEWTDIDEICDQLTMEYMRGQND